jgi:hypothetical protein
MPPDLFLPFAGLAGEHLLIVLSTGKMNFVH